MTTNATASIAGDLGDANGGVTYTARAAGEAGNALRVRQILDENEGRGSVEVVVVGNDVSVALSRASTPWPTCTAAEVVAAIGADPAASALVEATFSGDGSGTPSYVSSSATEAPWADAAFTELAGGSDAGGGGGAPSGGVTSGFDFGAGYGSTDYGTDVSTVPDLDDTLSPLNGKRVVAEAILRRLSTPRGKLAFNPDDGLDLRDFLSEGVDGLFALKAEIEAECEKDERVATVEATVVFTPEIEQLLVELELELVEGETFDLALAVSALTVEMLQPVRG